MFVNFELLIWFCRFCSILPWRSCLGSSSSARQGSGCLRALRRRRACRRSSVPPLAVPRFRHEQQLSHLMRVMWPVAMAPLQIGVSAIPLLSLLVHVPSVVHDWLVATGVRPS
jgi:hypothetical protein